MGEIPERGKLSKRIFRSKISENVLHGFKIRGGEVKKHRFTR